jgi:hypothetical protein
MSIIMQEQPIRVGEFRYKDVNYEANGDLYVQLCNGENMRGGTIEGGIVLVKLDVDGCEYDAVEVSRAHYGSGTEVDVIQAAIASLIVVRDALRSMTVAA